MSTLSEYSESTKEKKIEQGSLQRSARMQNFDDLDIEGRNPSQLSEEEREKVILECRKIKIKFKRGVSFQQWRSFSHHCLLHLEEKDPQPSVTKELRYLKTVEK